MKKLISAVSSLAMAATMVGAAVPFATGAADASASLEVRPFVNKDGSAVSTTITKDQIAAGNVTIPVGVYVVKESADITSMQAQLSVNYANGKTTSETSSVTFGTTTYFSADTYFSSPYTYNTAAEGEVATDALVGTFSEVSKGRGGVIDVSAVGKGAFDVSDGYAEAKCTNTWSSLAWIAPTAGYSWAGAKSDDLPVYVVDVNFAKGTAPGTYTIDLVDYASPNNPDNMSCTLVGGGTTYSTKAGNLKLTSLTVTVEGDAAETTTTAQTTTAAETTTKAATTTTPQVLGDYNLIFPNDNIDDMIATSDYNIEDNGDGTYTYYMDVKPDFPDGDLVAAVKLTPGSMSVPAGVKYAGFEKKAAATSMGAAWEQTGDYLYLTPLKNGQDPDVVDESKGIITLKFTIDKDFEGTVPVTFDAGIICIQDASDPSKKTEYNATISAGSFTKGAAATTTKAAETTTTTSQATTTTTSQAETTTTTSTSTTTAVETTTTTTAEPGTLLYGDTNCDGTVNIADVVLLNKWLNDASSYNMKDQGKINADCCDADGGKTLNASDSKAIIQSIVHLVTLPCAASDLK